MEGRLLCFLCVLVLGRAAVINHCNLIQTLQEKLLYDNRVLFMREYFPKDYKLYVKYEEVLRCQNITTLIDKKITVEELRYLWGIVNEAALQTIEGVLPQKHPTRPYIMELQAIFKNLLGNTKEEEASDPIRDILYRLNQSEDTAKVKAVPPKALLDNCYKVLYALYEDECALCEPRSDEDGALCSNETFPALSRTPCKSS
ncbi:interleukin-34 isoform X2 [Pyxicephalus adspersus]